MSAEQAEAEQVRAIVATEEAEVARAHKETAHLAFEAKRDLDEALPALLAAEAALRALNKSDILEIKTFQQPPALVRLTMEAVCALLGVRVWGSKGWVRGPGCGSLDVTQLAAGNSVSLALTWRALAGEGRLGRG